MNPLIVTENGKIRTKNIAYMDKEIKFWLMVCILEAVFLLTVLLTACGSQTRYTMPSGVQVELPHTPADTLKGGAR